MLTNLQPSDILELLKNIQQIHHLRGDTMTNSIMLRGIIQSRGIKFCYLASEIGISYQAFKNKLDNKTEFLPTEIEKLCELLGISELEQKNDIFFAPNVEKCST